MKEIVYFCNADILTAQKIVQARAKSHACLELMPSAAYLIQSEARDVASNNTKFIIWGN